MKVVLFCGGFGMRIREYSEEIPKPMVPIGQRPILWHVMKYYAHFGHKDFILCLGHQAQTVKRYFLDYDECLSNDFTLADGGRTRTPARRDIADWNITFVDTGISTNIGQRLLAVREHLGNEELFLANYSDGLTDFPLPQLIGSLRASGRVAAFLCVRPSFSVHFVEATEDGDVLGLRPSAQANLWINGGCFVFRQEIFDYIRDGEELVIEPFQRLMREKKLFARKYDGFFQAMDTFKERQFLEQLYTAGNGHAAWMVWAARRAGNGRPTHVEQQMHRLGLWDRGSGPLTVLCLGAHSDDIEIGCAGTLLRLLAESGDVRCYWVVLSGGSSDQRAREARSSANELLGRAAVAIEIASFRDAFFPYCGAEVKGYFEQLKERVQPDVVLTHERDDLHQDHRLVAELTWNTFRDHLILEYEIPKYDGGLGSPNLFVPLSHEVVGRKVALLMTHFASQRSNSWFAEETFRGLLRIRGVECNAPSGYAEAFHCRKCVV